MVQVGMGPQGQGGLVLVLESPPASPGGLSLTGFQIKDVL